PHCRPRLRLARRYAAGSGSLMSIHGSRPAAVVVPGDRSTVPGRMRAVLEAITRPLPLTSTPGRPPRPAWDRLGRSIARTAPARLAAPPTPTDRPPSAIGTDSVKVYSWVQM